MTCKVSTHKSSNSRQHYCLVTFTLSGHTLSLVNEVISSKSIKNAITAQHPAHIFLAAHLFLIFFNGHLRARTNWSDRLFGVVTIKVEWILLSGDYYSTWKLRVWWIVNDNIWSQATPDKISSATYSRGLHVSHSQTQTSFSFLGEIFDSVRSSRSDNLNFSSSPLSCSDIQAIL